MVSQGTRLLALSGASIAVWSASTEGMRLLRRYDPRPRRKRPQLFLRADAYIDKVVEEVQQEIHDLFIDTTWPTCPFHPNHPLWLGNGYWVCAQNGVRVAPLGGLNTRDGTITA